MWQFILNYLCIGAALTGLVWLGVQQEDYDEDDDDNENSVRDSKPEALTPAQCGRMDAMQPGSSHVDMLWRWNTEEAADYWNAHTQAVVERTRVRTKL